MPGNERLESPRSRLNVGTFQAIRNRLEPCFPGQTTEALEAAAEDAKGIASLLLSIDEGKDVAPVVIKLLNGDNEPCGAGTLRVARNPFCAVAVLAWQLSKGRRVNLDEIVGLEARNRAIVESYGTRQNASGTPMGANLLASIGTFAAGGPGAPQNHWLLDHGPLDYAPATGYFPDYLPAPGYSPSSTNPWQPATAGASDEWDADREKRVEEEILKRGARGSWGPPLHGFSGDLTVAGSSTSTPWRSTATGALLHHKAAEKSLEASEEEFVGGQAAEEAEDGQG